MYYHGTNNCNADNILKCGFMKPSIGDDHWLGDGYYFYKDEEYAFRWILLKYTNNFRNQYAAEYDNIYREYTILAAEMDENMRIFSLQNINNRLYFIKVKDELIKAAEYSDKFKKQIKNKGIVDGVVLNIMFEEMGLAEEFDAIEADFTILFVQDDSRLDYLPEYQLCVRRIDVINKIWKYSGEKVPEHYKKFVNEYNQSKNILKNNRAEMYKKRFPKNNKYNVGGK